MRKILTLFAVLVLIFAAAVLALVLKLRFDARQHAEDQAMMSKTDEELLGEHFFMPRDGEEAVDMNLYLFDDAETRPLVVNVHGGAFIAGDADALDTQSARISKAWNVCVATVNYKLANDTYDIAYGTREVADTVRYFVRNAETYHIDPERVYLMGYSAGGYHVMASALQLCAEGVPVAGEIVCYGFLRDVMDIYGELSETQRRALPPSLFVIAEGDPISEGSLTYEAALRESGVPTDVKTYHGALHGFIEENNPEYEPLHSHASMSPEQETIARAAENDIGQWLSRNAAQ